MYLKVNLTQLFEIGAPDLKFNSNIKSTASSTNSRHFVCPRNVESWAFFETEVLDFFNDLQSTHKYKTWADTFELPKFANNVNIRESLIQYYFYCNIINKINKTLENEDKGIFCTTVDKTNTNGEPDLVFYLIDNHKDMNISKTLIPIEIKKSVNINGSLIEKYKKEKEIIKKKRALRKQKSTTSLIQSLHLKKQQQNLKR